MKRIVLLSLLCLAPIFNFNFSFFIFHFSLSLGAIQAQNLSVSRQEALQATTVLLRSLGCDSKTAVKSIDCPYPELYSFSVGDNGFVLLSSDKNSEPILGYSLENPISFSDMPANIRLWLEGYCAYVRYNSMHPELATSKDAQQRWNSFINNQMPTYNQTNSQKLNILTMLKTTWNQSPNYNKFCPYDSTEGKLSVSGCTATATAQIMKYFNHPAQGYGHGEYNHNRYGNLAVDYGTYVWDSMPNSLGSRSSEAQIDAVATLIYHCGVAVHMNYSPNGSGGKTASYGYGGDAASENAFKYNFKYSPYVWTAFRCDYNDSDWKKLILEELQADRPVLYAGYDEEQGGHAFVIDGYKGREGKFHINWGWGGNGDGHFLITNLSPQGYNFNLFATATIGIEPYDRFGEATTIVNTEVEGINGASSADGSVTGGGSYNFGDTIVLTATANNPHTRFFQWSDGCRYNPRSTVATGGEVNFTAQFIPLMVDTIGYYTTKNSMNRAANIPEGLATDSVWGIKIDASIIKAGSHLEAIRLQGRKQANHTLSILAGTDSPEELLYEETFFDSLPYDFTFHTHQLNAPIALDGTKSIWIKLKCTEVDTPAVFSIWGGNPNGMLVGDNLTPRDDWKFCWMIDAIFSNNVGINTVQPSTVDCQLFPNPATNSVTIRIQPSELRPLNLHTITILDITGRTIFQREINNTDENTIQVDVSNYAPGVYFVRINNDFGNTTKKLTIK